MVETNPIVFIHYSWDSEKHKNWVLLLANRLVSDGVEVYFDRFDLHLGANNTYFMERIEAASKVLLIMTPEYKRKAETRKGGVGYEYQIINTEIAKTLISNKKYIPLLRDGDKATSIPIFLQSFLFLDMSNDNFFEANYIELLRNIYDEPQIVKPKLGKRPIFSQLTNSTKVASFKNKKLEAVFELGKKKPYVHKVLGKPEKSAFLVEAFWSHGLEVYYNRHELKVDGILLKRLPSGVASEQSVMGIKLGDSFAEVKSKHGNPLNWGLPDPYTSFAFYKINERYLTLSIYRNYSPDLDNTFKVGTITQIGYSGQGSMISCEPIVAISIEEIRNGKIPHFVEDKKSIHDRVDLKADFFHELYDIHWTYPNEFGGYYVRVVFRESNKTIDFWLYDLHWSTLVIRAIIDRSKS